jgi:alpha-tubulin suppressor-like RCC1 family protein
MSGLRRAACRLLRASGLLCLELSACGARTPLDEPTGKALAVTCGGAYTCAWTTEHRLSCWGANQYGQLGSSSSTGSAIPILISDAGFRVSTASAGDDHTCALQGSPGRVSCWGDHISGELGGDPASAQLGARVDVGALGDQVLAIGTGDQFSCALAGSGRVSCWGANSADECGIGSGDPVIRAPVEVRGLPQDIVAIALGGSHACALSSGGAVRCWGSNEFGQLGASAGKAGALREAVDLPRITGIAAGQNHSCALTAAGSVKCWGSNSFGQLGDRSTRDSSHPVDVFGAQGIARVAAGPVSHMTCALDAAGRMKCWGFANSDLIRGWSAEDGPIAIPGLDFALERVAMGSRHACVVTRTGYLLCWGNNDDGQLGIGTHLASPTAELVHDL